MKSRLLLTTGLALLFSIQAMAQTPKVTTDTRFARGATMAFGRIKSASVNGGSAIAERGFCYSETSEPTIDDNRTTSTLKGSESSGVTGTIYWLKDLKPATKYYMRAYVINKDGQVGYGDVIKFYTIPKGSIKLTMRDGGSTGRSCIGQWRWLRYRPMAG